MGLKLNNEISNYYTILNINKCRDQINNKIIDKAYYDVKSFIEDIRHFIESFKLDIVLVLRFFSLLFCLTYVYSCNCGF